MPLLRNLRAADFLLNPQSTDVRRNSSLSYRSLHHAQQQQGGRAGAPLDFSVPLSFKPAIASAWRRPSACHFSFRTPQTPGGSRNGSSEGGKDDSEFIASLRLVSRTLSVLLLGFGAFLCLQFPAMAGSSVAQRAASMQTTEMLTSGWAGLMAGCLHALTGPDHLAALAPLCLGHGKLESALVGALWGCGHDAGQVIFGLVFLLLKGRLRIELVRTWASRVVGVTLLAIGAVGLKEAQEVPLSMLAGEGPSTTESPESNGSRKNTRRFRTFAAGIVYGLQPDALIMILPALALPSKFAGAAYLGMFLVGTVVAMGSYTAFIGSCGQALQKRLPGITQRLTIGSSIIAIAFGICVLVGELYGINIF